MIGSEHAVLSVRAGSYVHRHATRAARRTTAVASWIMVRWFISVHLHAHVDTPKLTSRSYGTRWRARLWPDEDPEGQVHSATWQMPCPRALLEGWARTSHNEGWPVAGGATPLCSLAPLLRLGSQVALASRPVCPARTPLHQAQQARRSSEGPSFGRRGARGLPPDALLTDGRHDKKGPTAWRVGPTAPQLTRARQRMNRDAFGRQKRRAVSPCAHSSG